MLPTIILFCEFIALTILFVICGNVLRNKTGWYEGHYGKFFWIAADYFIGLSFYFVCVRTVSLIIHSFSISTYIVLISIIAFIIFNRKGLSITLKDYAKFALIYIPLFIAQLTFIVFFWVQCSASVAGVFGLVGSLHSPRYANISLYILATDSIPTLNQNYMQSVMAATPFLWGGNIILVSLSLFLCLNISFVWILLNSFLKRFFADHISHLFATILVMCGGLCLSTRHFLLIDSGWPWILSGYSDTVVSVASYVITSLLLINITTKTKSYSVWSLVIVGVNIIGWFAMGAQNVVVFFGVCFVYTIIQLYKYQFQKKLSIILISVFILSSIVGIVQDGMLTPTILQSKVEIPGLMSVIKKDPHPVGFQFGLPYYILSDGGADSPISTMNYRWRVTEAADLSTHKLYYRIYGNLALQALFIPFIVILSCIFWIKQQRYDESFNKLGYFIILTFFGGLLVAFPLTFCNHKWELSRFLAPGYFLIAVLTAIMIYNWGNTIKPKYGKVALILLTIFLCIGPFDAIYKTIRNNFTKRDFKTDFGSFTAPYTNYITEK
jgi:hypothetical protein